jgi:predicted GIY-YIG superfamily endonuclease
MPRGRRQHAETAKRHGASALSNKELQDLVTRMNLERQYSTLKGETQVKKGQKVIKEILGLGRTANDVIQFVNSPMGKHLRKQFTAHERRVGDDAV